MTPDGLCGGQGRDPNEIRDSGQAVAFAFFVCVVLWAIVYAVVEAFR